MMFLKGDKFLVEKSQFTGTIIDLKDNHYLVKWDHFEGVHKYSVEENRFWTQHQASCKHEIETYHGFRESYLFCKKCDKKA